MLHLTTLAYEVKARFHQAVKPFHYAAYLLHPTFRGKDLSADQRESARKWISDRNPQFLPLLVAYDTQSAPFPNSFFSERMMKSCPILWWKGALKDPNLSSVSASKFCFDRAHLLKLWLHSQQNAQSSWLCNCSETCFLLSDATRREMWWVRCWRL